MSFHTWSLTMRKSRHQMPKKPRKKRTVPVTPAVLKWAMAEAGFTYTPLDGGIGPISYPAGHFNPAPCAAIVQVKNGKYV